MLVPEFLEKSAERFPEKIALIHEEQRLTFGEVEAQANRLANALLDQGVRKQDRAAVYLEPSVEAVVSIFGILKAGGVFLVVNPEVKPKKLAFILNDCRAAALVTGSRGAEGLAELQAACPDLRTVLTVEPRPGLPERRGVDSAAGLPFAETLAASSPSRPKPRAIDIDLASLIYTSGTTGNPKGVMLTHLNVVTASSSIIEYLENSPDDIILNALPLSFDYGLYQVLMSFRFGGTVVQEKSFTYPYRLVELLVRERVTGLPLVPTLAAILLRLRNLKKHDFSHLRYITNTAQALPPKLIFGLQDVFPAAKIYSMYGLTECKRVSYLPPSELRKRPTSVGKAIPNTEVYLVDDEGRPITEPGRTGELVVRGAHVMKGYWNLPEETDRVLKPGPFPGERVLHTGDLFRMDEEGFLYFVSRRDDLIKVAGEKVSPREIENELCEMEEVSEAAVVGVADGILGQAVKAILVLRPGAQLTQEEVVRRVARALESFKVPKVVEFRKELPLSAHGKVSKKELR